MSTPHKARTEVWAAVERFSRNEMDIMNCVLELRARVEALEEAENDRRFEQAKAIIDKPAPAPASSLVERVAASLARPGNCTWDGMAADVLREVAVAARSRGGRPFTWEHVAQWLEQEADRG